MPGRYGIAMKNLYLSGLMIVPLLMGACSSSSPSQVPGSDIEQEQISVEQLYNEAADLLDQEKYTQAALKFDDVERQFPYSKWATKAQLMSAYAAYKADEYDGAIFAINRFIELHPGHQDIDYAYYLRALAFYEQISDVARDQEMTQAALNGFDAVIKRFPDSKYTRDSKLKRDLTLDHLAGKEMEIGRYYLNRNQMNAAINRFRTVIEKYQTTTHVPEALHRLVEAYFTLGLVSEAQRIAAVLGHNYPGSKWYQDSYKLFDQEQRQELIEGRGFIDRTVDSLFKPD